MTVPPLAGRTAVITGAASGIGRALAVRLSRHGCPVAIADADEHGLEETAGLVGGPSLPRPLDVRDRQGQLAFAAAVREWAPAPIGAVFNNAGVALTSPEKAAAIIHKGVDAGKARILVGPDAYVFDALTRLAPTSYWRVMERFETVATRARERRRARQGAASAP